DNVGVGAVTWSNDRGGSGVADGLSSWTISGIQLQPGVNQIAVIAQDTTGNRLQQTVTVTYIPSDLLPPSITITDPTTESNYTTTEPSVLVSGQASDDHELKTVVWSNGRGASGIAHGLTSWSALIPLDRGQNMLTFTAADASGKTSSQTLAVDVTALDDAPPTLNIISPTAAPTFTTTVPSLQVRGEAA